MGYSVTIVPLLDSTHQLMKQSRLSIIRKMKTIVLPDETPTLKYTIEDASMASSWCVQVPVVAE
jgi:hypothetical protein